MKNKNHEAAGYLLVAVALAGRALMGLPEDVTIAEATLTILCGIGVMLLGARARLAIVPAVIQLALELALCASGGEAVWLWLWPALRVLDLLAQMWLVWLAAGCADAAMQQAGYTVQCRWMRAVALTLCLAECILQGACAARPQQAMLATVRGGVFILYSAALLWAVILLLRAYRRAQAA